MKTPVHPSPAARRARRFSAVLAVNFFVLAGSLFAEEHTSGNPQLSSNPGAAYTIYLDFTGFNYAGTWNGLTPGTTNAYADVAANGTFTPQQIADIRTTWAGVSQQYAGFNINVTTIDPAVAGGQSGTDLARQTFYSNTPNLMHTVVGSQVRGTTDWLGAGVAGVSFQGTTTGTENFTGGHTNWIFSAGTTFNEVGNTRYLTQDSTHENGHGLGLAHQSDFVGTTLVNDYGIGDNDANGPKTGPGTYSAIMGDGNFAQRLTWRVGSTSGSATGAVQNDVGQILSTNTTANAASQGRTGGVDLHLVEDGKGHTRPTATGLALQPDGTVNFTSASGVIVPLSELNPQAIGVANYTKDVYIFTLAADSTIFLTAHDGTELLVAGVADNTVSLRSTLSIFNVGGILVGSGVEDASTLFETYNGLLPAGTYYVEIDSAGGHAQVNDPAANFNGSNYFDTGAYFLTGSGFAPVPEPGTIVLVACGLVGVGVWHRRQSRRTA